MDRDQRERERREGRRLSKGRSLEHDPVGVGVPRWTEEGYHIDPNAPRHLAQPQPGEPLGGRHPLQPQGRGRGVGMGIGFESVGGIGGQPEAMLCQRTVVGGTRGPQGHGPTQLQPPELREPPGTGPGPGPGQDPLLRRSKREKAESMLRNDSLSSDQSESLRPPPPRPYKSKRGGAGKRQTSVSSSEEEGGTTPEYSSCEDAEIESVSERGERGKRGDRGSRVQVSHRHRSRFSLTSPNLNHNHEGTQCNTNFRSVARASFLPLCERAYRYCMHPTLQ